MQLYNTKLGLKNSQRYRIERNARGVRFGNIQNRPTNDKGLTKVLNDEEGVFDFWSDEIPLDYSPQALRDLEEKYNQSKTEESKGLFANFLMEAYLAGKNSGKMFAIDKEKEVFWFKKALKHKFPKTYWLAACISKAGENGTENFQPLRAAMIESGYGVSEQDADTYVVMAALAGSGSAARIIEKSVKNPDKPRNKGILQTLNNFGLIPNAELVGELNYNAAIHKDRRYSWYLYQLVTDTRIVKKDAYDHATLRAWQKNEPSAPADRAYDFLMSAIESEEPHALDRASSVLGYDSQNSDKQKFENALIRNGTIPSDKLRAQYRVKAAIKGNASSAWDTAQHLARYSENPLHANKDDKFIADILSNEYEIDSTLDTAGEFILMAAADGHSISCWILTQAARNPTSPKGAHIIRALAAHNIEISQDLADEAMIVSALNGHGDAAYSVGRNIRSYLKKEDENNNVVKKLKENYGMDVTRQLADECNLLSALAGRHDASGHYFNLLDAPDQGRDAQRKLVQTLGVQDKKALMGTFATNILKNERTQGLLLGFYTNAELVEMSQTTLSKKELTNCRKKMVEAIRSHLPEEERHHQRLGLILS